MDRIAKLEKIVRGQWIVLAVAVAMPWIVAAAPVAKAKPKKLDILEVDQLQVRKMAIVDEKGNLRGMLEDGYIVGEKIVAKHPDETATNKNVAMLSVGEKGPGLTMYDRKGQIRFMAAIANTSGTDQKGAVVFLDRDGEVEKAIAQSE